MKKCDDCIFVDICTKCKGECWGYYPADEDSFYEDIFASSILADRAQFIKDFQSYESEYND